MRKKPLKAETYPRHARVERTEDIEVQSEESLGWAISYSDLLMVLMSFFIIFFSVEESSQKDVLTEIAISMNKGANATNQQTATAAATSQSTKSIVNLESLATKFDASSAVYVADVNNRAILLRFPDDSFKNRGYLLNEDLKKGVNQFVEYVKPFADQVRIIFIGHADSRPLLARTDELIRDNFLLSSLRAHEALQLASRLGLGLDNLYIQGNSSNTYNSRTISIRIEAK